MRKGYRAIGFILGVSALLSSATHAETVSQKEASRVAQTFFNTLYGEVTAPPKLAWNGRQLTTDRLFNPFYVYNSPKGGFVIISAENKAYPVIAFSRHNPFSRETLGEEENLLLQQYAREIELIRYDSRIPTSALHAWQNMEIYLDKTVNNPYGTTEFANLSEERKEKIEEIDRRNGWIAMPTAVEFSIYDPENFRPVTLEDVLEEDVEEIPFSFYEDFMRTVELEQTTRAIELEEMLAPTKPVLKTLGGGHFEITFPETVRLMRIYSLDGGMGQERYFKETAVVNADISALPPGFYAGVVLSDSGKLYGFKLYR